MKTRVLLAAVALTTGLFFTSCDKDEDNDKDIQKPVITDLEVGHNDTVHVGEGIHLDFKVQDNEALDYYKIEIHAEEEEHDHKSASEHVHWEFDSTFTDISGLKNKTVHHHSIKVPGDAEPGDYHFHLSVADKSGNLAEMEKEIVVAADDGEDHDYDHDHDHAE